MNIIKETDRKMGTMQGYKGICDGCQIDLEYTGEIVVIEIEKTDDILYLCPKDRLVCPNCNNEIAILKLYKNLEISDELKAMKHESTD